MNSVNVQDTKSMVHFYVIIIRCIFKLKNHKKGVKEELLSPIRSIITELL